MLGKELASQYSNLTNSVENLDYCVEVLEDMIHDETSNEAIEVIKGRREKLIDKIHYLDNLKVIE